MNPLPSLKPKLRDGLPFVYMNVATTADGKLAPANRHFVPFSSPHDHDLLLLLRTRCDAVMAGARTVDAFPVNMGPGGKKHRALRLKNGLAENNLRVVVSGSASINPHAEIFQHTFSPIIILTTERAPKTRVRTLEKLGALVHASGDREIDFIAALQWLRQEWNVTRLLCEGGGAINDALFRKDLVDEIYLTLCPTIFGGRNAPTMADGAGSAALADATQLKLKAKSRLRDEMYLVYAVQRARREVKSVIR